MLKLGVDGGVRSSVWKAEGGGVAQQSAVLGEFGRYRVRGFLEGGDDVGLGRGNENVSRET